MSISNLETYLMKPKTHRSKRTASALTYFTAPTSTASVEKSAAGSTDGYD
jgi:hypothetical protein